MPRYHVSMDPLSLLIEAWWLGPSVVGVGAVAYTGLTTRRRRARRLEVDAARHEVTAAQSAIVIARADVRAAQSKAIAAQAQRGTWMPAFLSSPDAHRDVQEAKRAYRSAQMTLRAKRIAVSAARTRMQGTKRLRSSGTDALPLAQLVAYHDAVTSRWLAYETDVARQLAYPQMTDPRHPATAAFFVAQRDASWLRPRSVTDRITPQQFVAYRDAVFALERAFVLAEADAKHSGNMPQRPQLP